MKIHHFIFWLVLDLHFYWPWIFILFPFVMATLLSWGLHISFWFTCIVLLFFMSTFQQRSLVCSRNLSDIIHTQQSGNLAFLLFISALHSNGCSRFTALWSASCVSAHRVNMNHVSQCSECRLLIYSAKQTFLMVECEWSFHWDCCSIHFVILLLFCFVFCYCCNISWVSIWFVYIMICILCFY